MLRTNRATACQVLYIIPFGMAVAILIDVTIVRSVLVPATMKLLGDRNWYLPGFLTWLPQLQVDDVVVASEPVGGDAAS